MGESYYVAVHQNDWPSIAAMNECLADLKYPVRIPALKTGTEPLTGREGSLTIIFEDMHVELEASITQWSSTESFAYGLKTEGGQAKAPISIDSFVPLNLNNELRRLGADAPKFEYGDYVLSLTLRDSVVEWRAGFLLMSALIRCSHGLGFDDTSYGGTTFADRLFREAEDMK